MKLLITLGILLVTACGTAETTGFEAEIRRIMNAQEKAWNLGDIDGFMQYYHPQICFLGSSGLTCGKEKVTKNYKESYPNPQAMGKLTFDNWEMFEVNNDNGWVSGTWKLFRELDTLQGRYSLLWQYSDPNWLILRDHSDIACD